MADNYLSASFAFTCTDAEMALLVEAFQAATDLSMGLDPGNPTVELLAVLPPSKAEDPWSGLRDLFCDPDYPTFGADMSIDPDPTEPRTIGFHGMTDFQPEPIATLIHRCCQPTLKQAPIGFEWAETCSKPWVNEFGGGWCAIHADRVECQATREGLAAALRTEAPAAETLSKFHGAWGALPDHPVTDWQYEVANGDTRLGYWDWVVIRQTVDDCVASDPFPD
ncbi:MULTISPECIES: hypothetical protein [Sphingomonadaceae]|uniref:hypothetical protein n=1 Tax=Sphingomonadales TaxID=204457 RepID=UPI0007704C23|nr:MULTISPECIES: hypothetical protein [Sphingomonadaceae]AMK23232.1 hypothetical protein K426_11480 [Sphingobium sp. TKS]MCF8709093.1 hypothetical protein [Rhizorhapis sp. SPR117]